jgi:hypothetical protein
MVVTVYWTRVWDIGKCDFLRFVAASACECIAHLQSHRNDDRMTTPDLIQRTRENAWIGDAVLELYVRSHILRTHGKVDAEMKTRFTCNQFLSCHGNPTEVEAQIGVIYQQEGLEAAFTWIRDTLEPLFVKQEAKRARRA